MVLIVAMAAALVTLGFAESSPPMEAWKEFKEAFGKSFENGDDEQTHYNAFVKNMDRVKHLREDSDDSAIYSYMTPFADVSAEDFASHHFGFRADLDETDVARDEIRNVTMPASFDWVAQGAVNEIKNQAQCGSCWAFSAVANIEGVNFVKNKKLVSLSEQELVDCDKTQDHGCGGGLPSNADTYLSKNKLGLELESAYPYTAKNGKACKATKSMEQVFVTGFKSISQDENAIAAALMQYGPLSIGINAGPMQLYHGGISNPSNCDPQALDHGVAIVAFGSEPSKYWTIRNSWGTVWGEKGYYRIIRGVGRCGLNTMVTTATMGSEVVTV